MTSSDHGEHFSGPVTQKALIRKNGKMVLVRYPSSDALAAGKLDMPGGRLNRGESSIDGIKREVKEEIGADIDILRALVTGTFMNLSGVQTYFVIYEASLPDPEFSFVAEEGEIGGVEWFEEKDLLSLPIIYDEYKEALKIFFDEEP